MIFDNTKGFNLDVWNWIVDTYRELMPGKWECVFRKPTRTLRQNRTIHALFPDLAVELNGLGIELRYGGFVASWTAESAKEFFKVCYLGGKKTSETTTKVLSDAVDKLLHDVNNKGGQLTIKDPYLEELLTKER